MTPITFKEAGQLGPIKLEAWLNRTEDRMLAVLEASENRLVSGHG